ncbi:hypothetical protein KGA66_02090 [Actinocrinis puniceicyclus]|uniref:Uncharacterized protein n=1 Tax=Actinocrinis puniceicyclus TaxID=977794 RepID=A0A8J8BB82_9ACTN|nr:hypothetical protein [Actinocrinis puniceicyclus]MBS2961821.1 hypothetical protein [Actinocrinis puniceicyclus]
MPTSTRKTEDKNRRALVALGAPMAVAAVAGALTFATPANAAGASSPLPFPTSVCGTATPVGAGSASPSASAHRSASATPKAGASASGTGSTKPNSPRSPAASPSRSASATASQSPAAGGTTAPSPSPSASSSSSGGFWGWLNGVWTWIWGSEQLPHAGAAVVMGAAFAHSSVHVDASGKPVNLDGTIARASSTPGPGSLSRPTPVSAPTPTPTRTCIPKSQIKKNTASSAGNTAAELPWHLSAPSMTMYSLTYNGVTTIQTANGPEQVLDFTAAKVTLVSMVTFSQQGGGKLQYVNGGQGQTVTLENVHLWSTSFTADVLGLLHQTFTPQNPGLLAPLQGITVPLPLLFTNVEADNAFLSTGTIVIPGFNGHGN